MCRLLGTVSTIPRTLDDVLGSERAAFLGLAAVHGDGWGHAWSTGVGELEVRKSPESALTSVELAELAGGRPAEAALTHLRWATLGLSVGPGNTHPFTDGRIAFAHNGSIAPPAALDDLIVPDVAARRRGDTDSERYFLALLSRLAEGASPAEALAATVAGVLAGGAEVHSLNCLLLTPDALLAVCCYDAERGADRDYYPLLHRRTGDTVVVASTGWTDSAGWSTVSNGQMLVVERGTLHTSVVPVGTVEPVAAVP
ncbi:class II glutamine amidotransferase [Modestobacter lapidis]|nr:class II glutamine amidotransferase [Modestobacter lapidis]